LLRAGYVASAVKSVIGLATVTFSLVVAVVAWTGVQTGLHPLVVLALAVDLLAVWLGLGFLALIYKEASKPYRKALANVVRDYYAEISRLEYERDPDGHALPSARLHAGQADANWAGSIYDYYRVPREDRYGD
jgi:hypothetical protein